MNRLEEERRNRSRVMMFISFDLVNCTLYKTKHKGKWVNGVSSILEQMMHAFTGSSAKGYRFWKMLGDEIVYTKGIEQIYEIPVVLEDVYHSVIDINEKIKTAQIGDDQTAEMLSVKATVWIADVSPAHLNADNIYIESRMNETELREEYLGTDIDGGFRIAKFTESNRVVISSDLAALFFKEESLRKNSNKIHFVAFRVLKGIWDERPYPIFMYHGDEKVSFKDSIINAKIGKKSILNEYIEELPQRIIEEPYNSFEEQLVTSLYGKDGLNKEVDQLIGIMKRLD